MIAIFTGALLAVIYGSFTAFQKKTPLFYKILYFAMATCFMGTIYSVLYELLWLPEDGGFYVGYLGFVGMFFFLFSSYYGAIDSLADGKEPELKKYRMSAGVTASCCFAVSILAIHFLNKGYWMLILMIPMSCTLYFALKHLLIPDVEMGIIKVMRPYNALVIALSLSMMLYLFMGNESLGKNVCSIVCGVLLAVMLPVARNGVRKWFI